MLKDITIGQYIYGNSMLHRADPRMKMILVALYMTAVFLITKPWVFIAYAAIVLFSIVLSGVPLRMTLKGLKPIFFIVIFTAVINIFTVKGNIIAVIWIFKITDNGLVTAFKMAMRLILLVTGASLLTFTTTPIALTDGMEKLMKPLAKIGFPAHEIAMMMSIALRFIPTILDETDKILKAQSSRGADFDSGNFIQKAKSFVPVLIPLFVSAFRRADELASAMEARCYRGGEGRTRMKQLTITMVDYGILALFFIFCGTLLLLQIII